MQKVKENGLGLSRVPKDMQNSKKVAKAAIKNDYRAIQFASPELKEDEEVILAAVMTDGRLLQYASPELRNNKRIVMTAIANQPFAIQWASAELRNDEEVILSLTKYASEGEWIHKFPADVFFLQRAPD